MKKYNIQNYIRYKEDVKKSIQRKSGRDYKDLTRDELIIRFLPLVENLGRKFSTAQQASGVLSINDIIQIGSEGLTRAVDKLDWNMLEDSNDIEKTLKSFFSKRIKGLIRRRIDMARGDMRIPEHKLNEIRNNPKDEKMVALFFNSIFTSTDNTFNNDNNEDGKLTSWAEAIRDESEPYNIELLNSYLKSLMLKHLIGNEYEVLRLSYGLDCDKHSAKEIASTLNINGASSYVRVSELKRQAIQRLIDNVDHSQVIDYL